MNVKRSLLIGINDDKIIMNRNSNLMEVQRMTFKSMIGDFADLVNDFFNWVDLDYYDFSVAARYILIIAGAVTGNFIKNQYFHNVMWFNENGINFGILNGACNFIATTLLDASGFLVGALGGYIVYIIPVYLIAIVMYLFQEHIFGALFDYMEKKKNQA
jgi:hypothetical protein